MGSQPKMDGLAVELVSKLLKKKKVIFLAENDKWKKVAANTCQKTDAILSLKKNCRFNKGSIRFVHPNTSQSSWSKCVDSKFKLQTELTEKQFLWENMPL